MWEVASALVIKVVDVNQFLKDGYEPFAITTDKVGWERIWLKRKVKLVKGGDVIEISL